MESLAFAIIAASNFVATAATTVAPAIAPLGSLASLGTSIAGGVQAGKKPPDPQRKRDLIAQEAQRRRVSSREVGLGQTLLTGSSGLTSPAAVGRKTLLGG